MPALQAKESVHPKHGAVEKLEHGIHSRLHHVERWLRSEIRIGSTLSKDGADGLDTRPSTIDDEVHRRATAVRADVHICRALASADASCLHLRHSLILISVPWYLVGHQ